MYCISLNGLEDATAVQLSDIEIHSGSLLVWAKIAGRRKNEFGAHYIPDLMDELAHLPAS